MLGLQALSYPAAAAYDPSDEAAFAALVAWLEDTKIRALPLEARAPLRVAGGASDPWRHALSQYLEELGYAAPYGGDAASREKVTDFLVGQAVALEYRDGAERYGEAARRTAEAAEAARRAAERAPAQPRDAPFEDLGAPEMAAGVRALAKALAVPAPEGTGADASLVSAVCAAATRYLDPAVLASAARAAQGGERATLQGLLRQFPLGFDLDDEAVASAATVLRLLYINDLRQLQTDADRLIVDVQEYTADPRTDANIGRVGR